MYDLRSDNGMKYVKKISIASFIVVFLLILFSVKSKAAIIIDEGKCGDDCSYTFDSDGVLTISGSGEMSQYSILNDKPFSDAPWGYYDRKVKVVNINNGITNIGDYAFYDCTELTSITIPESVTSIGELAFRDCIGLTSVIIPDGVTSIGDGAFELCTELKNITISNSVTSIGDGAFHCCRGLTSIEIPESVTSIGEYAFLECERLTSITIPNSVTSIGFGAFYYCIRLTSITIPESVTSIGPRAFYGCSKLTSIEIPESVISIGDRAFRDCRGLTSVIIPDGVTSIGDGAFRGCSGLTSIEIPASVTSIGDCAFSECDNIIIYGISGTAAHDYAMRYGIRFIDISHSSSNSPQHTQIPEGNAWLPVNGISYWYEGGIKQGTYSDPKGVYGWDEASQQNIIRGREIYDPVSDGWYWLDACYDGAKAVSKEVWMPYIYQGNDNWGEEEIWDNANQSDAGMAQQVHDAIVNRSGKWVRYDENGKMIKGWYTVESEKDKALYPSQVGNTYYYDHKTGLMAKGWLNIDGKDYHFDEVTGALIR